MSCLIAIVLVTRLPLSGFPDVLCAAPPSATFDEAGGARAGSFKVGPGTKAEAGVTVKGKPVNACFALK